MMDTNDALHNEIDDGTTQNFGTNILNGDTSKKEGEGEKDSTTYDVTANHHKRFARTLKRLQILI
jgi:hypothetical protein